MSAVVFAIAVLLLSWVYLTHRLIPCPLPKIPYNIASRYVPWGELVNLGLYNFFTGEVFSWLSLQCLNHRSPIIQLFLPPFSTTHPVVIISDLREIEHIVTKRQHEIDRAPLMHDWFQLLVPDATIGMSTGRTFKEQRRLWNTILSPVFLDNVAATYFHETILRLVKLWERKTELTGESDAFEVVDDIRMATLDAIWKMTVGSELGLNLANAARLRSGKVVRRKGRAVFEEMRKPKFYGALCTMLGCLDWVTQGISPRMYTWVFKKSLFPYLRRAEKVKNEVLDGSIREARGRFDKEKECRNGGNGKIEIRCALDLVLRQDALLRTNSDNLSLRDELLELLITGHETTASSIAWAIKYITDHPSTQRRLRNSLYTAFPRSSPTNLPSAKELIEVRLDFLDAVIAEVMRISNTGPVSFRHAVRECDVLGYRIPAGTPIILVTSSPLYDNPHIPRLEENSKPTSRRTNAHKSVSPSSSTYPLEHFAPERWLMPTGTFNPSAVHSLPFSAGSRGCFGKKIAMLEMRLMIALLVMRFNYPRLEEHLSRYTAKDGLTKRPTCCFIRPRKVNTRNDYEVG